MSFESRCEPGQLDLQPTLALHEMLIEQCNSNRHQFDEVVAGMRDTAALRSIRFEGNRELPLALSAIMPGRSDVQFISRLTETLHTLIETALNWTLATPQRLARHFPDHCRMAPYFFRTPGLSSWQSCSRYDAVVTNDGSVKFIELNTCCPAGFLHAPDSSEITLEALKRLNLELPFGDFEIGTLERGVLVDEILAMEHNAKLDPELVVLLHDENQLRNEMELMAGELQARGRAVAIAHAKDLTYDGTNVIHQGQPVSLTWNKIRVSTENSPNHCWKPGFEDRYAGFLAGLRAGAIVSINNLVGATVAEDKGLLALMHQPEFRSQLSQADQTFIDAHVLWTARLSSGVVIFQGEEIDLLPYVQANPDKFVIKPANEGRGFGVTIGRHATLAEWEQACLPNSDLPCVVQEYAQPVTMPVLTSNTSDDSTLVRRDMHLTIAMGVIRGRYRGLFSRVASDPVTNVGRHGMIQAVLVNSGP